MLLVEGFRLACAAERVIDGILADAGIRRRFYSQKAQDRWVTTRALPGLRDGYFVEVGAGDGRTHSNTYVLERDLGWRGLLVEPNAIFAEASERLRSSPVIRVCADREQGSAPFIALGYMGGLIGPDTDYAPSKRASVLRRHAAKVTEVRCRPLADILDDAHAPALIDFLSIDVEGAEYRVLEKFPFDRYSFSALTIERPTALVHHLLKDAGYVLERIHSYDGFYVSAAVAAKIGVREPAFAGMAPKFF